MPEFVPKKIIESTTTWDDIRQARLRLKWKIEDIASYLRIKKEYLEAIEDGRLDHLPAGLYGKNFLKRYLALLKIKPDEFIKNWQDNSDQTQLDNPFSRKVVARKQLIVLPKLIRNLLIVAAIAICFLYLLFYFRQLTSPPKLTVTQPEANLSLSSSNLTIIGLTETEAEVRINGEIVLNNNNGYFEQNINLKKGLNTLVIRAKKKYSREQIVNRQILVE